MLRQFKTDPVDTRRFPIYKTTMAACKVGCFECGSILDPADVKMTGRQPGYGTHSVKCSMCGMVKEFDVNKR